MKIETYRMSGAGNLFTVIDNRKYNFDLKQGEFLAPMLCKKNSFNDYESEGLMLINSSNTNDFDVHFFNPDGSTGMMCGNGGRCAVNFAAAYGFIHENKNIEFSMAGDNYQAELLENNVKLKLPSPRKIEEKIELFVDDIKLQGTYVNVGSDHFCVNLDNIEGLNRSKIKDIDLQKLGRAVRFHKRFEPYGVNFNLYQVIDGEILLRTYERGVENETGACGTGAISTALSAYLENEIKIPVKLLPTSGEELAIDIVFDSKKIDYFLMLGPAKITDQKTIIISENEFIEEKQ